MVERFADPILLPESAGVPAESFIILSQTNGQASFVDPSVRLLDYLPFNAEWQSPSLNRSDQRADMTLSTVTLYYFAEEETDMEVDGSYDGGDSWPVNVTLTLVKSDSHVRQATAFLHITGDDLRFRLRFPSWAVVKVMGYAPRLIKRARRINPEALHG